MDATKGDPEVLAKLGVGRARTARRWLLRGLVLLAVIGLGAGIWAWRARSKGADGPRYVTDTVARGDLRETVIATGTLSPLDAVQVGAEVTGRVTKVNVDVNDPVKEAQVIAEIDPQLLQAKLEEAQAQLQSGQAALASAKATVLETEAVARRKRELHARGLSSDADLDAAEAAFNRARAQTLTSSAQISIAQAGVKNARTTLNKAIIRSPIDGTVLARTVELGQTVTAGFQTPVLFTIGRGLTALRLKVDVDEADVGKVKAGQAATFVVDAYPKQQFSSRVLRLSNMPKDATTVITYEAELSVDNSKLLLRPGMTATATIVTSEKKDVLTVANAALRFVPPQSKGAGSSRSVGPPGLPIPGMGGGMRRGGAVRPASSAQTSAERTPSHDAVWVVRGGAVERVLVELGATDGKRTEIEGRGVTPGVQVATDVEESGE